MYVVSRVEGFSMDPITYVMQSEHYQVDKVFVNTFEKITKEIYKRFKDSVPMIFDETAKKLHNSQNNCYSCGEEFSSEERGLVKVRDHCHYTGKCRGALHPKCNLRLSHTSVFSQPYELIVTCLLRDWPTHRVM